MYDCSTFRNFQIHEVFSEKKKQACGALNERRTLGRNQRSVYHFATLPLHGTPPGACRVSWVLRMKINFQFVKQNS